MKYVAKGNSPEEFEAWKAAGSPDWKPTYSALQNPEKRNLHLALLAEQGWVCCYCGRGIDVRSSHIEHFRPQDPYNDLDLTYKNLFASCIRETNPDTPLHCGHAKGNQFDEALHISPLDPECERRFIYTLLGTTLAADASDEAAEHMCEVLKLNQKFLEIGRRTALELAFDPAFLATATAEDLSLLCTVFRRMDGEGKLKEFGHVLARYAEQKIADFPHASSAVASTTESPPA